MDNQNKKEYLISYENTCKKIVELNEQLESIREIEMSAKIQKISDMPKSKGIAQDLSSLMVKIEDMEKKIDDKIIESLHIRMDIENAVLKVENARESRVLRLRYIELKKWEEICVMTGYSWKHTHRIHGKALQNIVIGQEA